MTLRALVFSLLAVTLVLGCTRNEPAQDTLPPVPDFEAPAFEDDMDNHDHDLDEGTDETLDEDAM